MYPFLSYLNFYFFFKIIWYYFRKFKLSRFIHSFIFNIPRWSAYLFKVISIASGYLLTLDTWDPLISEFFAAVSKKLQNSFDKFLSSDITLSWSTKFICEHCETLFDRKGLIVFQSPLLSFKGTLMQIWKSPYMF